MSISKCRYVLFLKEIDKEKNIHMKSMKRNTFPVIPQSEHNNISRTPKEHYQRPTTYELPVAARKKQ